MLGIARGVSRAADQEVHDNEVEPFTITDAEVAGALTRSAGTGAPGHTNPQKTARIGHDTNIFTTERWKISEKLGVQSFSNGSRICVKGVV
ncbi:hypothetical protein J6590_073403 [Homalodisca vitripennis]|nr:hypothetical protein J6590_073403 [Homalodisca vitripennis]